jgi:glycerol-3-phosphate dehydrogenase (NAD(P)+)
MQAAVIGSGAWGTTLAKILNENGHSVVIWSHDQNICDDINNHHENKSLLPGISLASDITCTTSLEDACIEPQVLVLVVASKFFALMVDKLRGFVKPSMYLVSATKGINEADNKRPSELLFQRLPESCHEKIALLSGPNISREIALKKPSTTVISSRNNDTALALQKGFTNSYFRVYTNNDMIGTELGGTLKNIIAIAAGIVDGLELGDNAKSAIMVRGLVEISRFAVKFGARPETFAGLAGIGDLITTCSSTFSRNHFVGENLGKGRKLPDILSQMTSVAEGVTTTKLIFPLAKKEGIDMPVTEQIYEVLFDDKPVSQAIRDLMSRDTKPEN